MRTLRCVSTASNSFKSGFISRKTMKCFCKNANTMRKKKKKKKKKKTLNLNMNSWTQQPFPHRFLQHRRSLRRTKEHRQEHEKISISTWRALVEYCSNRIRKIWSQVCIVCLDGYIFIEMESKRREVWIRRRAMRLEVDCFVLYLKRLVKCLKTFNSICWLLVNHLTQFASYYCCLCGH